MDNEQQDVILSLFGLAVITRNVPVMLEIAEQHADKLAPEWATHMRNAAKGFASMEAIMQYATRDLHAESADTVEQQAKQATDSLLASLRLH